MSKPSKIPARPPRWVDVLLKEKFFHTCAEHASLKKNECNIFCATCASSGLCQHCMPAHRHHKTVQIRRYVYHDVVKLFDVEPLLSCVGIQSYYINNARVAFLNQRPQLRPLQGPGQGCEICNRSLQDSNRFCSIACKVESLASTSSGFASVEPSVNQSYDSDDAPGTPLRNLSSPAIRTLKRKSSHISLAPGDDDDQLSLLQAAANKLRRITVIPPSTPSRRKASVPTRSPIC